MKHKSYLGFYGPFCLHFYHAAYTDFPSVYGPFEFVEDAFRFAELFSDDYYSLVRLGCWTDKNTLKGYYRLLPIEVQRSLL